MSNLTDNTATLQAILDAANALPEYVIPLTSDPREPEGGEEITGIPINAETLGGVAASEYALKDHVEFENWSNENKTNMLNYILQTITSASGVSF